MAVKLAIISGPKRPWTLKSVEITAKYLLYVIVKEDKLYIATERGFLDTF